MWYFGNILRVFDYLLVAKPSSNIVLLVKSLKILFASVIKSKVLGSEIFLELSDFTISLLSLKSNGRFGNGKIKWFSCGKIVFIIFSICGIKTLCFGIVKQIFLFEENRETNINFGPFFIKRMKESQKQNKNRKFCFFLRIV